MIKEERSGHKMWLSKKWVYKLKVLPESGMGYQTVDVHLKNGTVVKGIMVVNCQIMVNQGNLSFSENDIQDIELHT